MSLNENMDELWQDFYATLQPRLFNEGQIPDEVKAKREARKRMIHFAHLYNQVASTGTKTPVNALAEKIGCSTEEVGMLVNECLELRLLLAPKRGSFRCELSMIAVRMIASMRIGLD